jgi:hypothetical protein
VIRLAGTGRWQQLFMPRYRQVPGCSNPEVQ